MLPLFKKIIILCLLIIISIPTNATALFRTDSIQISLITVNPGEEVYEQFGHTAIRVKELYGDADLVFNYGLFSFATPNFIFRFVKGETDYQLGITDWNRFIFEYSMRGSQMTEQILDLSPYQAGKVLEALEANYQPENRVYRYNFFYDNCSTRPRDIIENNIEEDLLYLDPESKTSFRGLIYENTDMPRWLLFGIDLALGSKADAPTTFREAMFLPSILMGAFGDAHLSNEAGERRLVKETIVLNEAEETEEESVLEENPLLTPVFLFWSFFVLVLIIFILEFYRGKTYPLLDLMIFFPTAVAGVILFFLNFISLHPAVDANYNCLWLHPFHFYPAIAAWVKTGKRVLYYYHFLNFVCVLLILLFYGLIPQQFNPAFFPIMGVLMLRSATYILLRLKNNH